MQRQNMQQRNVQQRNMQYTKDATPTSATRTPHCGAYLHLVMTQENVCGSHIFLNILWGWIDQSYSPSALFGLGAATTGGCSGLLGLSALFKADFF